MEDKKIKRVKLRHKGRKYPKITFVFDDNTEKSITVRSDLKTAERLHTKIKREIALGTFKISNYINDCVDFHSF